MAMGDKYDKVEKAVDSVLIRFVNNPWTAAIAVGIVVVLLVLFVL